MKQRVALVAAVFALVSVSHMAVSHMALARDRIRIVGSSTVFPFSTTVAEQFGKMTNFKTPIVESTGTGGGLKLFCAGIGVRYPDITNASRRIKSSEVDKCAANGVGAIVEVKFGHDGIVLANATGSPRFDLSARDIFRALAKELPENDALESDVMVANPNKTWKDVNPDLPDVKIEVLGPPPTSGTRDAFVELAMQGGCNTYDNLKALKKTDRMKYKAICHAIREDGAYVEAGENDNLIIQKLEANPDALGIFGFSFLDQNTDKVQGSLVDGVEPTFENIAAGEYGIARSLFFYVKKAHVGVVPGVEEFIAEFTSEKAWGEEGYLTDKGLIPLPDDQRSKAATSANNMTTLTM